MVMAAKIGKPESNGDPAFYALSRQIVTCLLRAMRHRFAMRKSLSVLFAVLACGVTAFAQMGGGANFDSTLDQLFDKTPVFSATLQTVMSGPGGSMNASSKMFYDHGNSRSEMDMANVSGSSLPPNALAQAKAMGLDKVVIIAPSSKTKVFTIYPNLRAYISSPSSSGATPTSNIQITKLGSEAV